MKRSQATLRTLALLLVAVTARPQVLPAQTVVTLVPEGGWLTLSVSAGATDTLRFILDTGAARSAVSARAAGRLGLEASRSFTVQGASGPATVSATSLDSLGFAGVTMRDIEVLILENHILTPDGAFGEMPAYDGVLGFDVLQAWDHILISAPERRLVLYEQGQRPDSILDRFRAPIPFEPAPGQFITHGVELDGHATTAILDSGARHLVLNDAAAALPAVTASDSTRRRLTQGVGTDRLDVRNGTLSRLDVGESAFANLPVRLSNLPVFGVFGLADRPAMLIGVPVLEVCPVLISYRERRVRYCG